MNPLKYLKKMIEIWLGRSVTENEVQIRTKIDGNEEIAIWNVEGISQPSINQIFFDIESSQFKKNKFNEFLKYMKLRDERDFILNHSMWLLQRHQTEKLAIELGLSSSVSLTNEQWTLLLQYWQFLRDIPDNIDLTNYTIDQITRDNKEIFKESPIDLKLTKDF